MRDDTEGTYRPKTRRICYQPFHKESYASGNTGTGTGVEFVVEVYFAYFSFNRSTAVRRDFFSKPTSPIRPTSPKYTSEASRRSRQLLFCEDLCKK